MYSQVKLQSAIATIKCGNVNQSLGSRYERKLVKFSSVLTASVCAPPGLVPTVPVLGTEPGGLNCFNRLQNRFHLLREFIERPISVYSRDVTS